MKLPMVDGYPPAHYLSEEMDDEDGGILGFPRRCPDFELGIKDLQSSILPLGHAASMELCPFHTAWQAVWQVPLAAEG